MGEVQKEADAVLEPQYDRYSPDRDSLSDF